MTDWFTMGTPREWVRRVVLMMGAIAIACASVFLFERTTDWEPSSITSYYVAAGATGLALTAVRWLPRLGLIAVVVLVRWPLWLFLPVEVSMIPLALAGWQSARAGAKLRFLAPVLLVTGILLMLPQGPQYYRGDLWLQIVDIWFLSGGFDISIRVLSFGVIVTLTLLGVVSRRERIAADELRSQNEELQRLRHVEAEQLMVKERSAIARDVHDTVAHHVAGMVIRAQAALRVADRHPEELRDAVAGTVESGQAALQSMRQMVRVLRGSPRVLQEGRRSLRDELDDAVLRMRRAGLEVTAEIVVPTGLDEEQQSVVMRVCQESLTNVVMHAGLTRAHVRLDADDEDVWLIITDDGPMKDAGPAPASPFGSGGFGLTGMRERVEAVGGRLDAARLAEGWRVQVRLPRVRCAQGGGER